MRKFGTAQTANGTCSCVNTNDIPNNKNNNTKGGNAWVGEVLIINFEEGKNEVPISEKNRTSICNFPVNQKTTTPIIHGSAFGMAATGKSQRLLNGKQK